jgi:hypothetical protein
MMRRNKPKTLQLMMLRKRKKIPFIRPKLEQKPKRFYGVMSQSSNV